MDALEQRRSRDLPSACSAQRQAAAGLGSFMVACSLGALANVVITVAVYRQHVPWVLASLAGIMLGAIWNYAMTSRFTWKH